MLITREKLREAFSSFAEQGNGVIVGPPGIGKTFLLKNFCDSHSKEDSRCLYLPIDKLGVENDSQLAAELGLRGEDVIEHFYREAEDSSQARFLVLDAFDAARSENAQRFFLNFIRRSVSKLTNRWNIVVSVRTYDARKSQELQDMFPWNVGTSVPREYQMPDITCRHFSIPLLSDEERKHAVETIDHLPDVFAKSSDEFKELLRIPFNLWLVEKLLLTNPDLVELSTINSDIQLLGLFWKYRVVYGQRGEERRVILTRVTRSMVEARSMSVRIDDVYEIGGAETWNSLMTSEILVYASMSEQRITFSHNILFDYAVSVLLMEGEAERLAQFLVQDPSRPLFLRPSLAFYFTRLWHGEPQLFWNNFWQLLPSSDLHVRLFARLLPPTVVVNELRKIDELQPLLEKLTTDTEVGREGILRVLQANRMLRVAPVDVWTVFLMQISSHIQKEFAWELAFATNAVLEIADKHNVEILRESCGVISRYLFLWTWQQRSAHAEPWLDSLGAVWATPLVAKTFDTAPADSELLLSKIFELLQEPDYPIDYFFRLSNEIEIIWPQNPEFVSTLYKTVFGHREISEARTQFGTPVMPLTSTRRQDFEMCRHVLIAKFPTFLENNPIIGTRTAIDCVNQFVIADHLSRYSDHGLQPELNTQEFSFRGRKAGYLADASYIWDQTYTDQPIKLADSLFSFIEKILADVNRSELIDTLLDELADRVLVAFFWKRLLDLGARKPESFVERLFELCVARPVLLGDETVYEVGSFIEAAVSLLDDEKRQEIEAAIISLTETTNENDLEFLERRRNRLLARIPSELIQTDEAKKLRQQLAEADGAPDNKRLFSITVQDGPYSPTQDQDLSSSAGGGAEEAKNQSLRRLTEPLTAFTSRWQNNIPTETDVRAILKAAEDAYSTLCEAVADADSIPEGPLTTIASCATTMSRGIKDTGSSEFEFCRRVLLTCAHHPSPLPHEEADRNYSHAYWSPAPRTEAAQGLPWLARIAPDPDMLDAIERLVMDPKPSVRFLVTVELFRLIEKSPEFFWKMALHSANSEQNNVITGALFRSLSYAVSKDEQRTIEILETLLQRSTAKPDHDLFSDGVPIVVGLAIARENRRAVEILSNFLESPVNNGKLLRTCVFNALTFVTPERLAEPKNVEGIDRAINWVAKAIDTAGTAIADTLQRVKDSGGWTEEFQNSVRDTYGVIDEIVTRLYFAARIKDKNYVREENEAEPTWQQQRQYYFKIKRLLELVVEFATRKENGVMFAPTAHYFMELLNGVLNFDPVGVLHLASGVAESSEQTGYNLDPMAVTEVVKLVEAVLADHRYEVRHGQPLQDLMNLLDIFAKTGDAQALNLVWRLDEIFR